MDWIFGKKLTPEELLKKNQRALNKAIREMEREKMKMEQQEKKLIVDIKKMAKEGQMDSVKIMAKDLVRTRNYIKKFILMKANIQGVSLKVQTLRSQNAMAEAMKGVTRAMQNMNRSMNLPQIQRILSEFEKQSEIMDMKEEMIDDTMDDALEGDDDEEETDRIVTQVLDELGLQLDGQFMNIPESSGPLAGTSTKSAQPTATIVGGNGGSSGGGSNHAAASSSASLDIDADLQARLDNLRKD